MTTVELIQLTKQFSNETVLENLSLSIAAGEFVVILGPSGSGKSTLLRLIAGLETPDDGDIRFNGQSVLSIPAAERNVAMVFQNYALYPHMSVWKNLAFPLLIRGEKKATIQEKVQEVATLLQLEHLLDRKPKELSGGQRQRVALGRAIIRQPAVLLMDEPLSNLDAQLRHYMRGELVKLQKTALRTTTLYVTHDQVEAMTMGDRIAVLDHGILQQIGTPEDIYHFPANQFVASFIGSPSMNFLAGTLVHDTDGFSFRPDALSTAIALSDFIPDHPPSPEKGILGIRPEYFQPTTSDPILEVPIEFVENTGYEYIGYFSLGSQKLCFRTTKRISPNSSIALRFHPDARLHWFHPNGKRVATFARQ